MRVKVGNVQSDDAKDLLFTNANGVTSALVQSATGRAEVTIQADDTASKFAPQIPSLVCPLPDFRLFTAVAAWSANDAHGARCVVPKTGTLVDLAVYIGNSSGNIDVGVYDLAEPRTKLYSTGSLACPAAGAFRIVGQPNIAVTQGQSLDLVVAADNAVATFGIYTIGVAGFATLPASFWSVAGASAKASWFKAAAFPLAATLADAAVTANPVFAAIIARVS